MHLSVTARETLVAGSDWTFYWNHSQTAHSLHAEPGYHVNSL